MTAPATTQHINLAISGAGVCGAAEVGAAVALMEAGYVVDNVAGTSAGSMLASVIAARMPADQLRDVAVGLNYKSFLQPANRLASFLVRIPIAGRWIAWNFLGGAYKLDTLCATVDNFLTPLGSRTWGEHADRVRRGEAAGLSVVSFNLNEGEQAVFPDTYADELNISAANRPISEAIGASVAIPTFFRPPRITDSQNRDWIFSDGGTIDDTPYDVAQAMNPQLRTVGITLDTPRPYSPYPKWGFLLGPKLPLRLIGTAGSAMAQARLERPDVAANTITVPTVGVDPNNFDITPQQAGALFDAGYATAKQWIARDLATRGAQPPPAPEGGLAA